MQSSTSCSYERGAASEPLLEATIGAHFRREEMDAAIARDSAGKYDAAIEPGVAVFLPGMAP